MPLSLSIQKLCVAISKMGPRLEAATVLSQSGIAATPKMAPTLGIAPHSFCIGKPCGGSNKDCLLEREWPIHFHCATLLYGGHFMPFLSRHNLGSGRIAADHKMAHTLGGHHTTSVQEGHVVNLLLLIRKEGGRAGPMMWDQPGRGTCARDGPGGKGGLGSPGQATSELVCCYRIVLPGTSPNS